MTEMQAPPLVRWAWLLLAILCLGLLVSGVAAVLNPEVVREPITGMALLEAHQCRLGETKVVDVRGVEDGFSPQGEEPMRMNPRLEGVDLNHAGPLVDYDSSDYDSVRWDYFEWPSLTVSGVFVIGLKRLGDNDELSIGDATTFDPDAARSRTFRAYMPNLVKDGWRRSGDVYWTEIENLHLQSDESLIDLIGEADGARRIDVSIGDDTMVDFMAAAVCVRPAGGKGLTFWNSHRLETPDYEIAVFNCDSMTEPDCNPFVGDQPCEREWPLLCYRDLGLPAHRFDSMSEEEMGARRWSGGEVAATLPVRGARFRTIAEADRYCADSFGEGWRVAEWHLGGNAKTFSARTGGRRFSGRFWVDIRGAPYGTCWGRDDGR